MFEIQGGTYLLDEDIIITEVYDFKNKSNKIVSYYELKVGEQYKFIKRYGLKKGYDIIAKFNTKKEAIDALKDIRKE